MTPAPFFRECRDGAAGRCGKLRRMPESPPRLYGIAVPLGVLAGFPSLNPGIRLETTFFLLLGAVMLSAIYGGVGPGFVTIVISMLLMRGRFPPELARYMGGPPERLQKLGG